MWSLVIDSGKHRGRQVKLTAEEVVIGRSETAQIRIGSAEVSREHCTLQPTKQGVLVKDHGSRNGTHINDVRIETEMLLTAGNILTVGPMSFQLVELSEGPKRKSRKTQDDQKLSDDDIAGWLTDSSVPGTGDTTIVESPLSASSRESSQPLESSSTEAEPSEPKRWVPPASKTRFDSLSEEAADIIRRHHEMLKAEEGTT
ncbi:MAG: FHA domain-containing protein [Planctomycetaceae bacterium]|nr:FHA domain-containing protein [Planctomycetaceae bacterium]